MSNLKAIFGKYNSTWFLPVREQIEHREYLDYGASAPISNLVYSRFTPDQAPQTD